MASSQVSGCNSTIGGFTGKKRINDRKELDLLSVVQIFTVKHGTFRFQRRANDKRIIKPVTPAFVQADGPLVQGDTRKYSAQGFQNNF